MTTKNNGMFTKSLCFNEIFLEIVFILSKTVKEYLLWIDLLNRFHDNCPLARMDKNEYYLILQEN